MLLRNQEKIESIEARMKSALESNDLEGVRQLIIDLEIVCPISGTKNWTEVRQFNMMFSTELGSVAGDAATIYLRPERVWASKKGMLKLLSRFSNQVRSRINRKTNISRRRRNIN